MPSPTQSNLLENQPNFAMVEKEAAANFEEFLKEIMNSPEWDKLIKPILDGFSNKDVLNNQKIIIQNQKMIFSLLKDIARKMGLNKETVKNDKKTPNA